MLNSYITTFEEYQAQRYEAASTIFGPYTLDGYIQEFSRLARDMVAGVASDPGVAPVDMTSQQIQLMPEAHCDLTPRGINFGDVISDVTSQYTIGMTVQATFQAANPRNNQRSTGSYMTVEQVSRSVNNNTTNTNSNRIIVAYDGDWSTKFQWQAGPDDPLDMGFSRQSIATLSWTILNDDDDDATIVSYSGNQYQLCYHGDHKISHTAKIIPFSGCSSIFEII